MSVKLWNNNVNSIHETFLIYINCQLMKNKVILLAEVFLMRKRKTSSNWENENYDKSTENGKLTA